MKIGAAILLAILSLVAIVAHKKIGCELHAWYVVYVIFINVLFSFFIFNLV